MRYWYLFSFREILDEGNGSFLFPIACPCGHLPEMKQVLMCIKARVRHNAESRIMRKTFSESLSIMVLGCSALLFSVTSCSRAPEAPPKTVEIQADDKMRFDVTAFEVKPGQKISV